MASRDPNFWLRSTTFSSKVGGAGWTVWSGVLVNLLQLTTHLSLFPCTFICGSCRDHLYRFGLRSTGALFRHRRGIARMHGTRLQGTPSSGLAVSTHTHKHIMVAL